MFIDTAVERRSRCRSMCGKTLSSGNPSRGTTNQPTNQPSTNHPQLDSSPEMEFKVGKREKDTGNGNGKLNLGNGKKNGIFIDKIVFHFLFPGLPSISLFSTLVSSSKRTREKEEKVSFVSLMKT